MTELLPIQERAGGRASPVTANVTGGGGTKLGKACEGSQVGSIPRGLTPAPRLHLPACKTVLGIQGGEWG